MHMSSRSIVLCILSGLLGLSHAREITDGRLRIFKLQFSGLGQDFSIRAGVTGDEAESALHMYLYNFSEESDLIEIVEAATVQIGLSHAREITEGRLETFKLQFSGLVQDFVSAGVTSDEAASALHMYLYEAFDERYLIEIATKGAEETIAAEISDEDQTLRAAQTLPVQSETDLTQARKAAYKSPYNRFKITYKCKSCKKELIFRDVSKRGVQSDDLDDAYAIFETHEIKSAWRDHVAANWLSSDNCDSDKMDETFYFPKIEGYNLFGFWSELKPCTTGSCSSPLRLGAGEECPTCQTVQK
jgi:hypothetical protein